MTPFPTQGSARAWGGVCFAWAIRAAKDGTVSRLAEPLKSALPGGGSGAARLCRAMGERL